MGRIAGNDVLCFIFHRTVLINLNIMATIGAQILKANPTILRNWE